MWWVWKKSNPGCVQKGSSPVRTGGLAVEQGSDGWPDGWRRLESLQRWICRMEWRGAKVQAWAEGRNPAERQEDLLLRPWEEVRLFPCQADPSLPKAVMVPCGTGRREAELLLSSAAEKQTESGVRSERAQPASQRRGRQRGGRAFQPLLAPTFVYELHQCDLRIGRETQGTHGCFHSDWVEVKGRLEQTQRPAWQAWENLPELHPKPRKLEAIFGLQSEKTVYSSWSLWDPAEGSSRLILQKDPVGGSSRRIQQEDLAEWFCRRIQQEDPAGGSSRRILQDWMFIISLCPPAP